MAGATRRKLRARQRFSFESVLERQAIGAPHARTTELGKGLEAAIKRQLGLK